MALASGLPHARSTRARNGGARMPDPTRRPDDARHDPHRAERSAAPDTTTKHPSSETDPGTVKAASPPAGAVAGAVAGATAGLATGVFGPIGAMVGAIVGALGGGAVGAAGGQAAANDLYTEQDDAHYRTLWESRPDRNADQGFEAARVGYQFGHIAARHPDFASAHFADIEPELRRRWPNELRSRVGRSWECRALVRGRGLQPRSQPGRGRASRSHHHRKRRKRSRPGGARSVPRRPAEHAGPAPVALVKRLSER